MKLLTTALTDVGRVRSINEDSFFVDDDSRAYLIYSSEENATLHFSLLTPDYLMPSGRYTRVFPGASNEAPTIFKKHGRYFLITSGCTGWTPNAARLAVADSIDGPWTALPNPVRGTKEQADKTFGSQGTFVLPAPGEGPSPEAQRKGFFDLRFIGKTLHDGARLDERPAAWHFTLGDFDFF